MRRPGRRIHFDKRLLVVALAVTAFCSSIASPASAHVTRHDLAVAQTKLHSLYGELDRLVEQYDQARVQLQQTEAKLVQTRRALAAAQAAAAAAQQDLDARARAAYEAGPSWMAGLLDTTSFADLSAGAQDLQVLSQQDEALAIRAQVAAATARHDAAVLQSQLRQRSALVRSLAEHKVKIQSDIGQATTLVSQIKGSLAKQAAAARAAAKRRAQEIASNPPPTSATPPGAGGGGPVPLPPPPGQGAVAAVAAARSMLGVSYVWGGASPSGFDCSGLTMWAWGRAGVGLPHSAAMQYAMLPHVPQNDLQPGDLVFFYSPIDHVGIYIGGGLMIDANHAGGSVGIRAVYWSVFSGAARP